MLRRFRKQRIADAAIRFVGVGKRFGETVAVDGVTLAILRGTIHALVGENGAGKSTLLGMLAGRTALSDGRIDVFGQTLQTGNVRASRSAGIVAIYQELTIVPSLSACANVFLGQPRSRFGFLSERAMRKRFNELCERLGVVISADVPAGALSVADQQMLEIIRALESKQRFCFLTNRRLRSPCRSETRCFSAFVNCAHKDVTILLVSHNLDEVLSIADDISVCRDGRLIRTASVADWTKPSLVAAMLGHAASPPTKRRSAISIEPFLRAEEVTAPNKIEKISVAVGKGEIVGIGGLGRIRPHHAPSSLVRARTQARLGVFGLTGKSGHGRAVHCRHSNSGSP